MTTINIAHAGTPENPAPSAAGRWLLTEGRRGVRGNVKGMVTEPNIRDLWDALVDAHSIANAVTTDTDEQRALVKQIKDTLDTFLIEMDDEYYKFNINGAKNPVTSKLGE